MEQVKPLLGADEADIDNHHLENFLYQQGLCQVILGEYESAKKTLLGLLYMRKRLYGLKGCCAVEPNKLLFGPYLQLCYSYEAMGKGQDALRVCEKAISYCASPNYLDIGQHLSDQRPNW